MKRILAPILAALGAVAVCIGIPLIFLLLTGCSGDQPPRGSAQDRSIEEEAKASNDQKALDDATVEAARLDAAAVLAKAAAEQKPTSDLIAVAADAQAKATVAGSVRDALAKVALASDQAAKSASKAAETEREAQERAADERWWVDASRWVGGLLCAAGFLLGALVGFATKDIHAGAYGGGAFVVTGLLILTLGSLLHWLLWLALAAVLIFLVYWAYRHHLLQKAAAAAAQGWTKATAEIQKISPDARKVLDQASLSAQAIAGPAVKAEVDKLLTAVKP